MAQRAGRLNVPRQKKPTTFRTSLELLERRDLMTSDLEAVYRSTAFLASTCAADDAAEVHSVGAFLASYALSVKSTKAPASSPAPAAQAKPAPVAPAKLDWYATTLQDVALRDLARQSTTDNALNRGEMLNLFGQVQKDGKVSAQELADLKQIVGKTTFFAAADYVRVLAIDVISGSPANAYYQGSTLGNLAAGSSAEHLNKLVNKWFLGADHPRAMAGATYQQASGSLFPHAPIYTDVRQGLVGDCYFVGSLAEAAQVSSSYITSMFINNGDGTYTVRFNKSGKADYVTVDSQLPVDRFGNFLYANYGQNIANKTVPLWVALAEKAYVQMNEAGWLRSAVNGGGRNSYDAIGGGYMFEALAQITGRKAGYSAVDKTSFEAALKAGKLITFASANKPPDASVVGQHAYAVVAYNKAKQQVTLFNPWGIDNGYKPGLVTLTWTQMKKDFSTMQYA
jgi:hypothetical protein